MVWTIYLADRVHDSCRQTLTEQTPLRHRFAIRNRPWMIALLTVSAIAGIAAGALVLNPDLAKAGALVAIGTALYFLIFRILKTPGSTLARFPGKEAVIAACFTAGVIIGAEHTSWIGFPAMISVGLFCLVLANCLLISAAETEHDRYQDPGAFFANGKNRPAQWIPPLFGLTAAIGGIQLFVGGETFPSIALLIASAGSAWLFLRLSRNRIFIQAASDAVLLVPWILLIASR